MLQRVVLSERVEDKNGSVDDLNRITWRVHWRKFRGCRGNVISREQDVFVAQKAFGSDGNVVPLPSDQKWDGLISAAVNKGLTSLINSANPMVNEHRTEWSDFMTIVPSSSRFSKTFNGNKRRPMLTFGISFKTEDHRLMKMGTKVLYLLEYLDVGGVIDSVLLDFVDRYDFSSADIAHDI